MADPRVIQATYADWKNVKTRAVVQLVFEVPVEKTEEVLKMLGAPIPGREKWVAIAVMDKSVPVGVQPAPTTADNTQREAGKRWHEMSRAQQAGILCNDERFQKWCGGMGVDDPADYIRRQCGVLSRAHLNEHEGSAAAFDELVTRYRRDTGQMAEAR